MQVEVGGGVISVPGDMQDGLERYVNDGCRPGNFLSAVLSNNLEMAVQHADSTNISRLFDYVYVIYNNAPAGCHGSKERFEAWIKRGGLNERGKVTIYKDIDENGGEAYTVYVGKKCMGSFLADDKTLAEYRSRSNVEEKDGLDDRKKEGK